MRLQLIIEDENKEMLINLESMKNEDDIERFNYIIDIQSADDKQQD